MKIPLWLWGLGAIGVIALARRSEAATGNAVDYWHGATSAETRIDATRGVDPVQDIVDNAGSLINPIQSVIGQLMDSVFTPRGERNNNPGNIRHNPANQWQGMAAEQTDSAFVQFEKPEYGVRALAILLRNYAKQGFDTVRKIIKRYAPETENNTDSYIMHVSGIMGVSPDEPLNLYDDSTLRSLIGAITLHENGPSTFERYVANGWIESGAGMA